MVNDTRGTRRTPRSKLRFNQLQYVWYLAARGGKDGVSRSAYQAPDRTTHPLAKLTREAACTVASLETSLAVSLLMSSVNHSPFVFDQRYLALQKAADVDHLSVHYNSSCLPLVPHSIRVAPRPCCLEFLAPHTSSIRLVATPSAKSLFD